MKSFLLRVLGPLIKPFNHLILKRHYSRNMKLSNVGSFKRVLIIAPHADDETIGAGGTIKLHANQGAEITCLVMTDGAQSVSALTKDKLIQTRKNEMAQASEILSIDNLYFFDLADGKVINNAKNRAFLSEIIEREEPDLIYCPPFVDAHNDHIGTLTLLASTLKETAYNCEIRLYEINCPIPPKWINVVIDISNVLKYKEKAISVFQSQAIAFDGFLELAKIKKSLVKERNIYAVETFLHLTASKFIKCQNIMHEYNKDFNKQFKQVNRSETLLWAIYKNYRFKERLYEKLNIN